MYACTAVLILYEWCRKRTLGAVEEEAMLEGKDAIVVQAEAVPALGPRGDGMRQTEERRGGVKRREARGGDSRDAGGGGAVGRRGAGVLETAKRGRDDTPHFNALRLGGLDGVICGSR